MQNCLAHEPFIKSARITYLFLVPPSPSPYTHPYIMEKLKWMLCFRYVALGQGLKIGLMVGFLVLIDPNQCLCVYIGRATYLTAIGHPSWNAEKVLDYVPGGTKVPQLRCKCLDSKFSSPGELPQRQLNSVVICISDKKAVKMSLCLGLSTSKVSQTGQEGWGDSADLYACVSRRGKCHASSMLAPSWRDLSQSYKAFLRVGSELCWQQGDLLCPWMCKEGAVPCSVVAQGWDWHWLTPFWLGQSSQAVTFCIWEYRHAL